MNEIPLIGMSPGNSYFKTEVVECLLKKIVESYGKAVVMIPDVPAISTYIALGYTESRARKDKAIPQGNALKNKVYRAMEKFGYSEEQVRVINWKSEVDPNPIYQEKYSEVIKLYNSNQNFKKAVNATTSEVLKSVNNEMIAIAAQYLLAELAFIECAPEYFNVDRITYIYHRPWPVYEEYIRGAFDSKVREYLGFQILTTNK